MHDAVVRPFDFDLERIPLAGRPGDVFFRRRNVVNAAGVLIRLEVLIAFRPIIEDLDLDARTIAVMIAVFGHTDVDARIATGLQLVVESQVEIAKLLLAPQPWTLGTRAHEQTIFDFPA